MAVAPSLFRSCSLGDVNVNAHWAWGGDQVEDASLGKIPGEPSLLHPDWRTGKSCGFNTRHLDASPFSPETPSTVVRTHLAPLIC